MSPLHTGEYGPGAIIVERFALINLIATGGMGEVWRANDLVDNEVRAVKILRPDLRNDDVFFQRLEAEATNLAALNHPAIARFVAHGRDDSLAYLAMEFVPGTPLSTIAHVGAHLHEPVLPPADDMTVWDEVPLTHPASLGVLTYRRVARILARVADALAHAHARGVVHRDIKPANILLSPSADGDDIVHVTDFGISLGHTSSALTDPGRVMGTAEYLAPERIRGAHSSSATDMYALGVTAFELVTGYRPFDGPTPLAIAMKHVHDDIPMVPAAVPVPLAQLITQLLAKDPAVRPTAASEVAARLAAIAKTDSLAPSPAPAHRQETSSKEDT
ncbi:MAG: serine/threonine-protein kinase [Bowdeniella nasicola]|nr:serine/threonine-protein kinase [Bowdeniella nasicola]